MFKRHCERRAHALHCVHRLRLSGHGAVTKIVGHGGELPMVKKSAPERRGPFVTTLIRYPGKGGWTFAPIPKKLAPPVTRPWGRTPVRAMVDGVSWDTSVWRDTKSEGALLAVPARIRRNKRSGDRVTVEFTFDADDD